MYAFEAEVEKDGRAASLLVVQAQRGETLGMVLERVRSRGIGNDGVVVRPPVDVPMSARGLIDPSPSDTAEWAFLGDAESRFRRARDRSVHVLTSADGHPHLTANLNAGHRLDRIAELDVEPEFVLSEIRRHEMRHLVDRSKALLTAPPNAVFRAPSGHLVANFVRVGNIQRDRDAVDAIFFWMLPHLGGVDAILVDTWSISSIAFNAARAATTYFARDEVRVEMLGGYVDGAAPTTDDARQALKRLALATGASIAQPRKVLVLISATQSGDLARRLRAIAPEHSPALSSDYLAIFRLGEIDFGSLCDLSDDGRFRLLDSDASKSVLEIDSQVYFPLAFEDIPVRLSKVDASRNRDLFDAYRGTGMVRMHCENDRTDGTKGHQAIRLDLKAILDHDRFRKRLETLLAGVAVPKAILAPGHEQARALAELVRASYQARGADPPILPTVRTGELAGDERQEKLRALLESCRPEDEIVIVDDVCTTTASLAQIDKQLRTQRFEGRVRYVVGIARLADPGEWKGFTRRLSQRGALAPHTIDSVESVPLPDWNADHCPWCLELDLYNHWVERGLHLPGQLLRRRQALAARDGSDIDQRTFLHPEKLPVPKLGEKSFFVEAPCSQAEVFAATAAALQTLRCGSGTDQPKLAERHFPIATPLDDQDYLEQKWTDTVIRAAILRGATRDELVWTDAEHEAKRTERFQRLLLHPDEHEHDFLLEILLAACMGKATLAAAGAKPAVHDVHDDGTTAFLLARIGEPMRAR